MNKRCIVNVATGDFYCKMQQRLIYSMEPSIYHVEVLDEYGSSTWVRSPKNTIDLMAWKDCLPNGSRPHSESPYGFKVHAIKAAYEKGYTSILWLDSPAWAVKEDISPIFDKIEKEGYYAMSHIDPLENYVGSRALEFFKMDRRQLIGYNLPSGSCYGFDIKGIGYRIFARQEFFEMNHLFKSQVSGEIVHRHDEAVLALNLLELNLPVFTFDPLFQSDSPECVIKSGGL